MARSLLKKPSTFGCSRSGEKIAIRKSSQPKATGPGRWFRVKVTDTITGKMRANIRLPISLVSAGLKMGAKFSPEMDGMDMNVLHDAIRNNQSGLIIDVIDDEDSEHVEIFIEE